MPRQCRQPPYQRLVSNAGLLHQHIVEVVAELALEQLAGGGVRQGLHEQHLIGQPPFGDLAFEERQQFRLGDLLAVLLDHEQDGPLVPLGMRHADDGAFGHGRMRHGVVLKLHRADPFAARFDHILGAVDDVHGAGFVDGGDVARIEPAVHPGAAILLLVVAAGDPGPAHEQPAERLAVARKLRAVRADDLQLDAECGAALLRLKLIALLLRQGSPYARSCC